MHRSSLSINLPVLVASLAAAAVLSGCNLDSTSTSSPNSVATASPATTPMTAPSTAPSTGWASLSWGSPGQNTDGTALTDLAGYRIYYGSTASDLSQVAQVTDPLATSFTVTDLVSGTWYFALTAVNSEGVESERSAVASKVVA